LFTKLLVELIKKFGVSPAVNKVTSFMNVQKSSSQQMRMYGVKSVIQDLIQQMIVQKKIQKMTTEPTSVVKFLVHWQ
jgi:hypothetical protein